MKRILYIAHNADAVLYKINSQKKSFEQNGYKCDLINQKFTLKNFFNLRKNINDYDVVYIRNSFRFILWSLFWRLVFCKCYVILEMPTPISAVKQEVKLLNVNFAKKILYFCIQPFFMFIALFVSDLIIEYADDKSKIVNIFRKKILLIENGINDVSMYNLPDDYFLNIKTMVERFVKNKELNIIFVANLQDYHGLERFILGLGNYYKNQIIEYKVNLSVVAPDNALLDNMKVLVDKCEINDYVRFLGKQPIEELHKYYVTAHIGLGPIAMFKIGLLNASPLKIKEYAFFGLSSIIDYHDYDLSNTGYILHVKSNDTSLDINEIIQFYKELINKYGYDMPDLIHKYANNNLLWVTKVKKIIERIEIRD